MARTRTRCSPRRLASLANSFSSTSFSAVDLDVPQAPSRSPRASSRLAWAPMKRPIVDVVVVDHETDDVLSLERCRPAAPTLATRRPAAAPSSLSASASPLSPCSDSRDRRRVAPRLPALLLAMPCLWNSLRLSLTLTCRFGITFRRYPILGCSAMSLDYEALPREYPRRFLPQDIDLTDWSQVGGTSPSSRSASSARCRTSREWLDDYSELFIAMSEASLDSIHQDDRADRQEGVPRRLPRLRGERSNRR